MWAIPASAGEPSDPEGVTLLRQGHPRERGCQSASKRGSVAVSVRLISRLASVAP
jgi:hypothetical protein